MTNRQAKDILLRYRPGSPDEQDAEVRAALEHANRDPELRAWLADHRAFQSGVRNRLRSVDTPAGLREQILSERPARFRSTAAPRRLQIAGVTAVLLLLAGAILWMNTRRDAEARFETFRARMVKTALRGYAMDLNSRDPREVRDYLAAHQGQSDWRPPPGLAATPLIGCAALTWQGQPASLICYGRGTKPDLWLFIVDTASLPDPPADGDPQFARVNRLNTLSWSADGRTYVLAGAFDEQTLRAMVDESG